MEAQNPSLHEPRLSNTRSPTHRGSSPMRKAFPWGRLEGLKQYATVTELKHEILCISSTEVKIFVHATNESAC